MFHKLCYPANASKERGDELRYRTESNLACMKKINLYWLMVNQPSLHINIKQIKAPH